MVVLFTIALIIPEREIIAQVGIRRVFMITKVLRQQQCNYPIPPEKQDQYLRETFGLSDKELKELQKEYEQRKSLQKNPSLQRLEK